MKFIVDSFIEKRSDNPNLIGYRVSLDDKTYIMYYSFEKLREVYFMSNLDNHFFSCRTDMKTFSDYYVQDKTIKRYEDGKLTGIYWILNNRTTVGIKNGQKVVYKLQINPQLTKAFSNQLYTDLVTFLEKYQNARVVSSG